MTIGSSNIGRYIRSFSPLGALLCMVLGSAALADSGMDAVIAEQNKPAALPPSQNARNVLAAYAREKGYVTAWDNNNNRIVALTTAGGVIPPHDPDFIVKRESFAIEAILLAKARIIESFISEASAENILSVPGSPIADQLEKEQRQLKALQASRERMLQQAQAEAADLMSEVNAAQAASIREVGTSDRLKALLDAAIKQLDESYSAEGIAEEKKQRVEDLKLRLQRAQEYESQAIVAKREIDGQVEELRGQITKEQRSDIALNASMPLFGATVIAQVESYDELRESYQLAILLAWSPKLEADARNVLLLDGRSNSRAGKLSLDEWLNKQDLGVMVGPRRYLASDGSINFMGISAVEYDPEDIGSYSILEEQAILWAKQLALLSVTADVESQKAAERLRQDSVGDNGKTESRTLESMSLSIRESIDSIRIKGLETVRVDTTTHPASGKHIIVAVANINSVLAAQAGDIMKDTYATLQELNAEQSVLQGQVEGMRATAASTRNNESLINQSRQAGANMVNNEVAVRKVEEARRNESQVMPQVASPAASGGASSGTWISDSDEEEDF